MNINREGDLLSAAMIREVIALEQPVEGFKEQRELFRKMETVLARNIVSWIDAEVELLIKRFPELKSLASPEHGEACKWVGHLLERYIIRGFMLHKKATTVELNNALGGPTFDPPNR